ncbi:phosphogluconate dehydrogenase (NAD(+)-dependent, decarboxylating) [Merdibacter massiliensis]|uniref:phosphogluconate dehydrogenase (NAD(+)-dependent, decarboxylating) n=1 Tax=Merdibacter massiliensis TaxID=1871030 RepID=UPI00096AA86D|nr:decarboxylating 6-phosphogluconate dehydrogenase [Merdibacter massiliensis]
MNIGLIGLGKMGSNLALNLVDHGHDVIGFDLNEIAREELSKKGISVVSTVQDLVNSLPERKVIWMMVPSGKATDDCIQEVMNLLGSNDIVIDAGNSNYKDSIRHAQILSEKGLKFLDVGTSGGTSGARHGACLMIGGDHEAYEYLENVFMDVSIEDGCLYTGNAGSGHFMKMVHNGIEYGMMQAIGEGFQIMRQCQFDYNLAEVAKNWNHGSVIRGWLMEIAQNQFEAHPDLADIKGVVAASGEAKWTVETALELEVPVPVIALSLMVRNRSQEEDNYACKVVSALRNGFGGHAVVKTEK